MSLPSAMIATIAALSLLAGAGAYRTHLGTQAALASAEVPACGTVAPDSYPGWCNTTVSAYACYSTKKEYSPDGQPDVTVPVPWACSSGQDAEPGMTDASCKDRDWEFKGNVSGREVEFVAAPGIYQGLCSFNAPVPPSSLPPTTPSTTTVPPGSQPPAAPPATTVPPSTQPPTEPSTTEAPSSSQPPTAPSTTEAPPSSEPPTGPSTTTAPPSSQPPTAPSTTKAPSTSQPPAAPSTTPPTAPSTTSTTKSGAVGRLPVGGPCLAVGLALLSLAGCSRR
mmetsp:Transcript_135699/g.421620  ORF Transcript_135699/g.421620 Transcript_135699/m.421620 type:complete len:280 (-) Transcript_135699:57-896(-)